MDLGGQRLSGRIGQGDASGVERASVPSTLPGWAIRLFELHAPRVPEKRRPWLTRDLHRFLSYTKTQSRDKQLPLLATEYIDVLRRSEPPLESWQVEQARQAVELFVRSVTGWRWQQGNEGQIINDLSLFYFFTQESHPRSS
jgi:hypothetical protein